MHAQTLTSTSSSSSSSSSTTDSKREAPLEEVKNAFTTVNPQLFIKTFSERNAVLKIIASCVRDDVKSIPPNLASADWKDHAFFTEQLQDPAKNRPILEFSKDLQNWSMEEGYKRYNPLTKEIETIPGPLPDRGRIKLEKKHTKKTAFTLMGLYQTYFYPTSKLSNGQIVNLSRLALLFDLTKMDTKKEKYCFPSNAFTNGRFWKDLRPDADRPCSIGLAGIRTLQDIYAESALTLSFHNEVLFGACTEALLGIGIPDNTITDRVNALTKQLFYRKQLKLDLPLFILSPGKIPDLYTKHQQYLDILSISRSSPENDSNAALKKNLLSAIQFFDPHFLERELCIEKDGDRLFPAWDLAVKNDNVTRLQHLMDTVSFSWTEANNPQYESLFKKAVNANALDCVKYLLEHQPTWWKEIKSSWIISAHQHLKTFKFLLSTYGENLSVIFRKPDRHNHTGFDYMLLNLHNFISNGLLEMLLSLNIMENSFILQSAIRSSQSRALQGILPKLIKYIPSDEVALLLFKKINLSLSFFKIDNKTPLLFWLIEKNFPKSLEFLLEHRFLSPRHKGMKEVLNAVLPEHGAAATGKAACLEVLLKYRRLPLTNLYAAAQQAAIAKGHSNCVALLDPVINERKDAAVEDEYTAIRSQILNTTSIPAASIFQLPSIASTESKMDESDDKDEIGQARKRQRISNPSLSFRKGST